MSIYDKIVHRIERNRTGILTEFVLCIVLFCALELFFLAIADTGYVQFHKRMFLFCVLLVIGKQFCASKSYWFLVVSIWGAAFTSTLMLRSACGLSISIDKLSESIIGQLALINVAVLLPGLFPLKWYRKFMAFFLILLLAMVFLLFWGYYFTDHLWLGADAILAILQTNQSEAVSYVSTHLSLAGYILLVLTVLVIILFVQFAGKYGSIRRVSRIGVAFIVVFCCFNAVNAVSALKHSVFFGPFAMAVKGLEEYEKFSELRKQRNAIPLPEVVVNDDNDGVYVLVIGESETRRHMSAYGYERQTTPWLDSMVQAGRTLLFKEAYSCHTHTVPVLTYALTEKNQYNNRALEDSYSLVEVLNAAGYETIWLSNQVQFGAWDTPIRVIADAATKKKWLNTHMGETTDSDYHDEKILSALDGLDVKGKTFIVIHLMGSHGKYSDRYPVQSAVYLGDSIVDTYDNSVYYNDWFMGQLCEKISKLPNFRGMMYFSDHGEEPEMNLGHNSGNFTPSMAEIPLYMFFSKEYMELYPERFQALNNARNTMFTNDLIYNAVLGIMGVRVQYRYEEENDITNMYYNGDRERFFTLYGSKKIVDF